MARIGKSTKLLGVLLLSTAFTAPAFAQIETVIVTAEKKAEDIQTVPVAVTAFSGSDLQSKQIKSFNDIQFNMPSLTFTKTSLGGDGASIAIRGIGPGVIAASGDAGVSFNVNDVYINAPQLGANATYLDVERLELLRGPQGTLFGRNATGGALNIITNKPDLDKFTYSAEATYGNYDDKEITGVANIPLIEGKLGLRLAGSGQMSDGDVKNIYAGIVEPGPTAKRNFDGLDNYTGRATLRWEPTADTTIDIIAEHDQEASTRVGANVLGCVQDPTGVMGCLPTGIRTDAANQNAVITNTFVSDIGPLGGTPYQMTTIGGASATIIGAHQTTSGDLYKVASDFQPWNRNFFNNAEVLLHQKLGDELSLDAHVNYANRSYNSASGFPGDLGAPLFYDGTAATAEFKSTPTQNFLLNQLLTGGPLPPGFHPSTVPGPCSAAQPTNQGLVAVQEFFACQYPTSFAINYAGHLGQLPISSPALYGISGGTAPYYWVDHPTSYMLLSGTDAQKSAELRIASSFAGPLNFLLAGYHLETTTVTDTSIHSGAVDLISTILGATGAANGYAYGPSVYDNISNYSLSTDAVYGEVYYDILPDTLKFTGGLRFGSDHKRVLGFNTLLNCFFPVGALTGAALTNFLTSAACGGQVPGLTHAAGSSSQDAAFSAMTGRGIIDWTPKLPFTDQTLVYVSYSRGYRAGGFNPPADTSSASTYPPLYKSEGVDAVELGTKNLLLDGTVQANLDFWYYNYENYQVTQIVNKTAINANVGARMWGAEGELLWAPDDHWAFNANYSFIDSRVGDASLVDSRNEAQNQPNVTVLKDFQGNQCIITNTGLYGSGTPYPIAGTDASGHAFYHDGVLATVLKQAPVTSIPGVANGAAFINGSGVTQGLSCGSLQSTLDLLYGGHALDPMVVSGGEQVNLAGRKVPNTPPFSFGVGVQYTFNLDGGYTLVPRVDYYWKGGDYFTIFNSKSDRIPSWDEINAQLQLNLPDNGWYARLWVKNLADKQNITGGGAGDAAQGLFNTLFVEPPRTYGISVGAQL